MYCLVVRCGWFKSVAWRLESCTWADSNCTGNAQELEACESFTDGCYVCLEIGTWGILRSKDLDVEPRSLHPVESPMLSSGESFQAYRLWTRIVVAFFSGVLSMKDDKLREWPVC